ncbi:MAG: 50S ribosomal protein L9 [Candidatus Kerfeldbacteria bacterium]|nr:50S ribosomal protein L9 [Candidatus Kerfeldbacteria bacterium]
MDILLLKDHSELGRRGEVVTVPDGFARNFLLPRKIGAPVTAQILRQLELERARQERRRQKQEQSVSATAKHLDQLRVTIPTKVTETGRLFAAVSRQQIRAALQKKGFEVVPPAINFDQPIDAIGDFKVKIQLALGKSATVLVSVISDNHDH